MSFFRATIAGPPSTRTAAKAKTLAVTGSTSRSTEMQLPSNASKTAVILFGHRTSCSPDVSTEVSLILLTTVLPMHHSWLSHSIRKAYNT